MIIPFGMGMPGRKYAGNNSYRYGFNGQEKSEEIRSKGNSYTAEFWEYDPGIGRRWNIDPIIKDWESPYACFFNNPVRIIDPYGLNGEDPKYKTLATVYVTARRRPKEGEFRSNPANSRLDQLRRMAKLFDRRPPLSGVHDDGNEEVQPAFQRYHRGSKYFEEGWYPDGFYELTTFDWDNGQVMDEYNFLEDIILGQHLGFGTYSGPIDGSFGGRNWNGYQVDDKGYFTGNIYLGSRYIEANRGRSVTRFFGLFAKLIRGSRSRAKVIDLIQNNKLKNIAKDLFRPNARVGNGSFMDAFRYEQMFGGMVGGRTHAIKLLNYRSALQKLWKDRSTLNRFDRRVTKELLNDIQNALQCN